MQGHQRDLLSIVLCIEADCVAFTTPTNKGTHIYSFMHRTKISFPSQRWVTGNTGQSVFAAKRQGGTIQATRQTDCASRSNLQSQELCH
ncbi:hypothetical protein BJX66DRAFT_313939 [Aspergillus keveii]|uniref:Secreted protein n=1 Tax=Aspergillus keveii TaxID=714993 RepID=A0ABR4FRN6_9EURO